LSFSSDFRFIQRGLLHKVGRRRRQTQTESSSEYMYLGGSTQLFYRRRSANPRVPSVYNKEAVWGNVYCQALQVGLASYHFLSPEEGAYISYEHPSTGQWPPLDNGEPIPSRVYFHNVRVEGTSFRGEILWQQDCNTTWQRMSEWIYHMVFDQEFTCIVSGQVLSRGPDSSHTPQEMSTYGESLVYVNAAMYTAFRQLAEAGVEFDDAAEALNERLSNEGGTQRTVAAVYGLFSAAFIGAEDPID
jgi:hypothetical protein